MRPLPRYERERLVSEEQQQRVDETTVDAQTLKALAFVRTLVGHMQMSVEVNLAPNDGEGTPEEIRIEIEGPDAGRIIGKKGNVLDAIQYLTARVVVRPGEPRRHVIVDAEGYRARREANLRSMALRIANQVRRSGQPVALEAMPPNERRIIHMTLAETGDISTESTGEGDQRRVVVSLKNPTHV